MQCASSMAIRLTDTESRNDTNPGTVRRSGATYRILIRPMSAAVWILPISDDGRLLFTNAAGMPFARRASTWSFMSAMSGETTSVSPSRHRAGNW